MRPGTAGLIVVAIVALAATLTPSAAFATFPGADGRIVFVRESPHYGLFTAAPDGSDVRELHPGIPLGYLVDLPTWSANGRWIAYTCGPETATYDQVCMMRPDGSNARQVSSAGIPANGPSFSPDGRKMLYDEEGLHSSPGGLFVVNIDGSDEHRLVRQAYGGAWAPDGRHIAYDYPGPATPPGIWIMRPDGSHRHVLYAGGQYPRYGPRGHSILFEAHGTTMRMRAFGGNPHPIDTKGLGGIQVAPAGGCRFGTVAGRAQSSHLYARGGRCPATGLLVRNVEYPSWQPLP